MTLEAKSDSMPLCQRFCQILHKEGNQWYYLGVLRETMVKVSAILVKEEGSDGFSEGEGFSG